MIGTSLLVVVLLLTLAAIFFNKSSEGYKLDKKVAYSVYLATLVTIVTAAYLIYLFLSDQFQYVYVWSYSSQNLDVVYKITGLWAGQQGSFLLWLMIHAVVGSIIVWRKSMNKASFNTYLVLQAMLLVLLFYKNPFEIAQTVLQDGAGLNPLLQNFWMVSHPPLLFMGYAMLAVPFSYAMGALMSGDYNSWLQKSRTFTLAAWAFLASGIFLGAYWAYDTLGWG
ncbi:MAG: cytochrome c biogenesis protein CcsA, partial [Veillonella sp.]|nr:cytochrome c biogenesis protein CcsA [Veillonella sp.]